MTIFSAVHRHSMISFTPVMRSVCAKFNNCDRQNTGRNHGYVYNLFNPGLKNRDRTKTNKQTKADQQTKTNN